LFIFYFILNGLFSENFGGSKVHKVLAAVDRHFFGVLLQDNFFENLKVPCPLSSIKMLLRQKYMAFPSQWGAHCK
jgi:hypothetical protein